MTSDTVGGMAKPINTEWLTIAEAAGLSHIKPRTLQRYIQRGLLKGKAVSTRLYLVRRRDVERLERLPMGRPLKKGGKK